MEGFFSLPAGHDLRITIIDHISRIYFSNHSTRTTTFDDPVRGPIPRQPGAEWVYTGSQDSTGRLTYLAYINKSNLEIIEICLRNKQVYYRNAETNQESLNDPIRGGLPSGWTHHILPRDRTGSGEESGSTVSVYYFPARELKTYDDPRYVEVVRPAKDAPDPPPDISSMVIRRDTSKQIDYVRQPISSHSLRHNYTIHKIIDSGDGGIGGMNGGVFVVRHKKNQRLYVEKRFKPLHGSSAVNEIQMMYRLQHDSLAFYIAAFIDLNAETGKLVEASVFIEFCDLGSLGDLVERYSKNNLKRGQRNEEAEWIPEPFLWHAFIGLCDGLAYLQTGKSKVASPLSRLKPGERWKAVLHRDVKADNVLLRSRSMSNKYPYVVLSDFGLVLEEESRHNTRGLCGTLYMLAPEMCWQSTEQLFKDQGAVGLNMLMAHSKYSDTWALGAVILGAANLDICSHFLPDIFRPRDVPREHWAWALGSRKKTEDCDVRGVGREVYGKELGRGLERAMSWGDPSQEGGRPDAEGLLGKLLELRKGVDLRRVDLPGWAWGK